MKELGVRIIVVDRVSPGFRERNIGALRNLGFEKAMEAVSHRDLDQHFIAHMDADTRTPGNYLTAIESRFSDNPEIRTILLNRRYYVEPGSQTSL